MNLPGSFTDVIRRYGIEKNDVVFAATGDLDEEQRFADSIVALTKEKLIEQAEQVKKLREKQ